MFNSLIDKIRRNAKSLLLPLHPMDIQTKNPRRLGDNEGFPIQANIA
jgi:hypothetical protein